MDTDGVDGLVQLLEKAGHEDPDGFVKVTLMSIAAADGLTLRQALNKYRFDKKRLDHEDLKLMIPQIESSLALLQIDEVITEVPS